MTNIEKQKLRKEYAEIWNTWIIFPLRWSGWFRFDFNGDRIIPKKLSSILYNLSLLLLTVSCILIFLYVETVMTGYLWTSEVIVIFWFITYLINTMAHITIVNRKAGAHLMNYFIEIDILLGAHQTKFIRKVTKMLYFTVVIITGIMHLFVSIALILTYDVDLYMYVPAIIFFAAAFSAYYDAAFFFSTFTSLTMRIRYLNVSVMKLANMNPNHVPKQFPFNSLIWPLKLDKLVDFHKRTDTDTIVKAYRMMFNQLQNCEDNYRNDLIQLLGGTCIGTFVTVQNYINVIKSNTVENHNRVIVITAWCFFQWIIVYLIVDQLDMLHRQITQTQLICTYIQLKPTYRNDIYELTSQVIGLLENRNPRFNLYNMFNMDKRLLLRYSSSIFVYITMQLQIAFPKRNYVVIGKNSSLNEE